ncbi:beta-galactosidase [Ginsengibacter hankyongi]|uniref:Beta-galactosidase n=1 Tax=Ginsengibacter hankyongi TaxID=2607284 RepID=A0A5J5IGQ1_9BACT|nr:sugar-binding domain-containing protein [Ginsengibacter hankyongi]KAA9037586.1 beta-galactosidase [Ginsengibacter hankyongi]
MKNSFLICLAALIVSHSFAQKNTWKIVPGRITTPWADSVDPSNVLNEYPRPQLQRKDWINLNGLWQYSILPNSDEQVPANFQGNIFVPFAIESSLSGVGKSVGKDSILWYQRTIDVPVKRKGKRILLHFGAIDWRSDVFINGKKVGRHEGGYDPFTFDITGFLNKGSKQQLSIRVWDPTDDGPQPRGKQVVHPEGIWYTSVTGIWQTVWMEIVPQTYIAFTRQTPDVDKQTITVSASVDNLQPGDEINISAWKGNEKVAEKTSTDTAETLSINNPETWSPSQPFLYDLKLTVTRKGKIIDEVKSYFAMRKISVAPENGIQKMMLNNKFLFEFGPLDQGWWPDGLYTAPTDNALKFDIETLKEMGFNMIRKHIKVEPARWYYYCDKLGMLVWQDMPSGDLGNHWEPRPGVLGRQTDKERSPESEGYYRKEWNAIMDALYNFPSIVVWTPFNEAWGQFKTIDIANKTKQKDPSRLVNSASGGNYYDVGDIVDLHNYPDPAMPRPEIFGAKKALVLGEFGGLGLPVAEHTWQQKNWGYQSFKSNDSLFMRYNSLIDHLQELVRKGLSAAVYTQTTDVEGEVNGFMTYDRKVIKMPLDKLREANEKLYNSASDSSLKKK